MTLVKIYDKQELVRALSDLQCGTRGVADARRKASIRRRRGLWLSLVSLMWSAVVLCASTIGRSPLPKGYLLPMPFLALGSLAYLFAEHAETYTTTTMSGWIWSRLRAMAAIGRTIAGCPRWAYVALFVCGIATVVALAKMKSRPDVYAVQDRHGYWLEDKRGNRVGPIDQEAFRNFGAADDRPVAIICFDLSLLAIVGFAYGPGSIRRSDDFGRDGE